MSSGPGTELVPKYYGYLPFSPLRRALTEHLSQKEFLNLALPSICSLALILISRCSFAHVVLVKLFVIIN
jgi:hypothetical protein